MGHTPSPMKMFYRIYLMSLMLATSTLHAQTRAPHNRDVNQLLLHTVLVNPTYVTIPDMEPRFSHQVMFHPGLGFEIKVLGGSGHDTLQLYDDAQRLLGTWHEDAKGAPTRINLQPYPPGLYTLLRRSKGVVFRLEVERRM